jgi:hypothetical protein
VISKQSEEACEGLLVSFSEPVRRRVTLHGMALRVVVGPAALTACVETR